MARDSVGKTIGVALGVCVVCASVVSAMAVGLRADQKRNAKADVQKNILMAAQIYDEERPIEEQFERVEPVLIDLETGEPAPDSIDPATFDQRKAAASSALSTPIDSDDDLAGIKKRSKYAFVYLVRDDSGAVESYVFPVNGKGLWSTLYGMLALEPDLDTVKRLLFYEHKETPGLGGEVDNPIWRDQWIGKEVFGPEGNIRAGVIKGGVPEGSPEEPYKVDGITGATITSQGVERLIKYWLGEDAFGKYIDRNREVARG